MISSTDDGKRTPFTKLERGNVESREKNTKKRWQDTGNSCKLHSSLWKNTNSPHRSRCLIDDSQFLAWVVKDLKKKKKERKKHLSTYYPHNILSMESISTASFRGPVHFHLICWYIAATCWTDVEHVSKNTNTFQFIWFIVFLFKKNKI